VRNESILFSLWEVLCLTIRASCYYLPIKLRFSVSVFAGLFLFFTLLFMIFLFGFSRVRISLLSLPVLRSTSYDWIGISGTGLGAGIDLGNGQGMSGWKRRFLVWGWRNRWGLSGSNWTNKKKSIFFHGHIYHTFNCLLFLPLSWDRESGVEKCEAFFFFFFFLTKKKKKKFFFFFFFFPF